MAAWDLAFARLSTALGDSDFQRDSEHLTPIDLGDATPPHDFAAICCDIRERIAGTILNFHEDFWFLADGLEPELDSIPDYMEEFLHDINELARKREDRIAELERA